ncbi:MAG: GAF domain-containing protein [Anaerolineales bacterium]|jgi:signal transduction histidine kinase
MLLTREELRERLIALHQASLELVKDVSLETLLERIATVACEQAEARYAALGVLDDDGKLEKFISVGMSEAEVNRIAHPPVGKGLIGELMNAKKPLRVPVIEKHPRSSGFPANHPSMTSFLGVPILAGEKQLGQIYLTDKIDADAFNEDDEKIIQMLAAYAAAAIQNARLYQHLKERDVALTRRSEDLTLMNDFASTLTASLELDEILNKTLALVMNYMKVEAGEIFLLEDDRTTLRLVLHRGQAAEAFWTRTRFKVNEGFIGIVAKTGEPLVSHDLGNDLRFVREAVVKAGFTQIACIPLESTENMVGVLSVATRSKSPIDERDIRLLTAVANWAALAIENARLHQNARRLAVLEERERIGMDLHDGIIQSIFGVGLSLENISHLVKENPQKAQEGIAHAIDDLNHTIRDLRAYILDLRPRQLNDKDLMDGLRRLITEYRAHTLAEAILTGPKEPLDGLQQNHALAMFHICQEALANAAKHAAAKRVNVSVWVTSERVLMEIQDNGRGFDMKQMNSSLGHGLANMQTRARNVGGEVDISSSRNEGTTVLAWVPRGSGS